MDVNPTAPNLDRVLRQQLTDGAHELAPRVNLKELQPPQGVPLVNPSKAIATSAAVLLVRGSAAGDVNGRESITEGFLSYAIVWQEEQVCLMDLVWYRYVKFRPWYVSWSRQIDLPDGLLFKPVLGLLLSHLCCRRQLFDGCEPFPVTSGNVADSFLSGFIEVFQQPDKPPTWESHGPRSLSNCRNKRPEKIMYVVNRRFWSIHCMHFFFNYLASL